MTVTDYPDWQTPQAHATQIAATGVPLLRGTNQLSQGAANVLAGGATQQILTSQSVGQPGYEVAIETYMAAGAGTVPFLRLTLYFWDSASGLFGSRRDVVVSAGNGPTNQLAYYIRGPMHANMFRVDATNLDPSIAQNLTWAINQTSHVYEHDEARQYAYAATAPNGFNNPKGVPTANLIHHNAPAVAASSSVSVLAALYSGDVQLFIDNTPNAGALTVALTDPAGYVSGSPNGGIFKAVLAGGATLTQPLTLPFSPVNIVATNVATSGTLNPVLTMTGTDH